LEKYVSIYFIPLFTLPVIINEPGEYLTRGGDRVTIDRASTRHDYGCVGSYVACGTAEKWHKSGRILATSETSNDVVCKASCEAAPAHAAIAAEVAVADETNDVQVPQATWAQKIKAIRRAAEGVGKRAIREVNRNLAEGVEHMEYKDFSEFDCSCEDEYIYGEAVHLIEELNLPFDDALKVVMAEDSKTA
jgi:predicted nucleic acid-binding protein